MSLLNKPFDSISFADLEALVEVETRETSELEFKGTLPFRSDKTSIGDRWIERGDRIGDYAKEKLIAELVAFANADGGTLILGVHETKDEPRRAARLETLPNCEILAKRLVDVAEDSIEPRLPHISAKALPTDENGNGYVILRVGKSPYGPHRSSLDREFYIRRGERAAKMTVREIQELTLRLARSGDQIEEAFQERKVAGRSQFMSLLQAEKSTVFIRISALPAISKIIEQITKRNDIWLSAQNKELIVNGNSCDCWDVNSILSGPSKVSLRKIVSRSNNNVIGSYREIRHDGLVELCLIYQPIKAHYPSQFNAIYAEWVLSAVLSVNSQIEHLRSCLAWDSVDYGIDVEIFSDRAAVLKIDKIFDSNQCLNLHNAPLTLPRYLLTAGANADDMLTEIVQDLVNAWGIASTHSVKVKN